jgi:hypothetical protein
VSDRIELDGGNVVLYRPLFTGPLMRAEKENA